MTDLGTLGGPFGTVLDLNNHGQVLSAVDDASGQPFSLLWSVR